MAVYTGIGYDVHRFVNDKPLWLGGVEIPSAIGLEGHSDADVLLHAISDALLGAAGLGDIGRYFPDTSPEWKGVKSTVILDRVNRLLVDNGFKINNVDSTLILESPKIAPFSEQMKDVISGHLKISRDRVNIKATTHERLGTFGRSEGAAALAVVTLESSL